VGGRPGPVGVEEESGPVAGRPLFGRLRRDEAESAQLFVCEENLLTAFVRFPLADASDTGITADVVGGDPEKHGGAMLANVIV
jgi:hypothetical protein